MPKTTTTETAPKRVNLWVNHSGFWLLECANVLVADAHAVYRDKVASGTDARHLRIFASDYAGTP